MSMIEAARELPPGLDLHRVEEALRGAPDPELLGSAVFLHLAMHRQRLTGNAGARDDQWLHDVTTDEFVAAIELVKGQLPSASPAA